LRGYDGYENKETIKLLDHKFKPENADGISALAFGIWQG